MAIEKQVRRSIRDAVNRSSRRPFQWGGVAGYEQLQAIAERLRHLPEGVDKRYLRQLLPQVERALEKNRGLYQDVQAARAWLLRLMRALHYPYEPGGEARSAAITSQEVHREVEDLLSQCHFDKGQPVQAALYSAAQRLWRRWSADLLHCYDIASLPPDNTQMEACFGQLRRHQRRISGQRSTAPLRALGQYQILFSAESEADLLAQMRQVSREEYQAHRRHVDASEEPRRHLRRLHRDPAATIQALLDRHTDRCSRLVLAQGQAPP